MSSRGQYSCVLCEMKLNSKEALKEHFRKHANKKIDMRGQPVNYMRTPNTQCDICNQSFDTVRQTIRHRFKVHSNSSTKFHCSYCGKQFPLKNHRDNHEMSHDATESENKDRHRKCEECNLIFYNEKALDYHCRSIHKRHAYMFKPIATPPPSNKIKLNSMNDAMSVYYCHLCGVEYVIKFNLQRHLENVHTQKERETVPDDFIKCTVCSAMFCSKKAYNVHNAYHQPDDLYVTSEQQRMQTVTKVDQDFDVRRVERAADKYIPKSSNYKSTTNNHRTEPSKVPKTEIKVEIKRERSVSLEDPLSINESSDSESDIPLDQRIAS